ncbi:MAG: hypothetical protein HFG58_08040 [Lachnospiraceae bacterium]|nr:hypothetical protein [Lachnospiraceae bacterium]
MRKWVMAVILSQVLAINIGIASYAGQWYSDSTGWWYDNEDGTWPEEQWLWLDGNGDGISECYYFNHQGYCLTDTITPDGYQVNGNGAWIVGGVIQTRRSDAFGNEGIWKEDRGKWYFEGIDGKRKTNGWYWLDGNQDTVYECYYLDENGWLMTSAITPDGYQVNEDGAWIENGVVRTRGINGDSDNEKVKRGSSGGGGSSGKSTASNKSTSSKKKVSKNKEKKISKGNFWDDYEDRTVRSTANDFTNGNYDMMTTSQIQEVNERINAFKRKYIDNNMSDFEKEMQIIRWIVENCDYECSDRDDDWTYSTAYSCLVKGKACCSGYADAFLQIAKACGLSVRYIYNTDHAWNLVRLDGEWYHVDVTWDDSGEKWGGPTIFTNVNDESIRRIAHHTSWTPSSVKAKGVKYGPIAVEWYLEKGSSERSGGKDLRRLATSQKNNVIQHTNLEETISQIQKYMENQIQEGQETFEYVITSNFRQGDLFSYIDIYNLNIDLLNRVYGRLLSNYGSKVEEIRDQEVYKDVDENNCYYIYKRGRIEYKKQIDYIIRFMENGVEIGRQTGAEEKRRKHRAVNYPKGYIYDYHEGKGYTINSGGGYFNGGSFEIYEGPLFDMSVNVKKEPEKYTYKTIYEDMNGHILYSTGRGIADKDSIVHFTKIEFPGYIPKPGQKFEQKLTEDGQVFYFYYEEVQENKKEEEKQEKVDLEERNDEQEKDRTETENKKREDETIEENTESKQDGGEKQDIGNKEKERNLEEENGDKSVEMKKEG